MTLIERAKNIIVSPKSEWEAIKDESTTITETYTRYVLILAAIPAVCQTIGLAAVGMTMPFGGGTMRLDWGTALSHGILSYVVTLVAVLVIAYIMNALAPTFGGQKNLTQAVKVTAYSWTPGWLAGVFSLIPSLGLIGFLVGLYGIYLLYLGLPRLMGAPQEKSLGYTLVVIICAFIVMVVLGLVVTGIAGPRMPAMDMSQINIQIPAQ